MTLLPFLLMAAVWLLLGGFIRRRPETLAGYNTAPPERRRLVDIAAAGRCLSRWFIAAAALTAAGLPWAGQPRTAAAALLLPVGALLLGAFTAMRRYDLACRIRRVRGDRRRYLPLLLEGDESEATIARYLDRCDLWALRRDGRTVALCAVTDEGDGIFEVQNLAVDPAYRRRGYGTAMLLHAAWRYRRGRWLTLGTGETPSTLAFYRRNGFVAYRRDPDYFPRHYEHPIVEEGVTLRDRILMRRPLGRNHSRL